VGGVDEVGRGAFAGPVVAGCVIFEESLSLANVVVKIDDSKKLSFRQREKASEWIKKNALGWGVGVVSVGKINKLGISKATQMAFRKAIKEAGARVGKPVDYLLIDAFYIPFVRGLRRKNQKAIIHGDARVISVAAASIVAKVARDKIMVKLSQNRKYRKYGWEQNKGYGTLAHRNALQKYGITRLHRQDWVD
jgi:ribonuclease HII